mgnify:FL=1
MYAIIHLPTQTYYSLKNDSKHNVVYFRQYEHAKYIADSLSTHKWIYNHLPENNKELYVMKPYQTKREAMENKLWVQKQSISMKTLHDLATRNLDITLVNDLKWLNDDSYEVDAKNIELTAAEDLFKMALNMDNDIVVQ